MVEACAIFRYPVGKLVNVFHRGWKVITTKPRTLGRTLECGFKIPPGASLYGTRWWIVGINKFPPYRKTLRVQYAEKSASREFARNYDPLFPFSSSSQFQIFPRYPPIFLDPLSLFIFYSITNFPLPSTHFPTRFFPPHPLSNFSSLEFLHHRYLTA